MNDVCYYLKKRNVDKYTQMKIRRYMEYLHEEETNGYQRGGYEISLLSSQLKSEMNVEIYGKLLYNIPLFKKNFSKAFIERLCSNLEELTYAPDEIIYKEKEDQDKDLFYVIKGDVELTLNGLKLKIQQVNDNDSFGEWSFVTNEKREFTAKSLQVTNLIRIRKDKFLELLQDFPKDKEYFNMLKDDINLYNNTALFEKKCPSCEKNTHTLFKCPMINYIPSYYRIISKHTQSLCQTRKEFPRKIRIERKKYPNLKNLKIIQEKAEELTFQNPNYFIQMVQMLEFDQSLPSFSEIENSLKKRIETSSLSKSNFSLENIKEIQTDNNQNQLFGIPHEESMEEINFNRIKQVKFECPSKEERNLERSQSLLKNPSFPSLANEKTFGIIRKNTNSDEIIDKSTENFIHRFGKNSYWDGIEGFEKMKDYEFYYPGNNISQIKKNYNRHEARKKSIFELLKKKYYTKKKNIKTD